MKSVRRPSRQPVKRHPWERFRATMLVERWTNAKAALIGHMCGIGMSSIAISATLRDGTSPETIRKMRKRWNLPESRGLKVRLTPYEAFRLRQKAAAHGIDAPEYSRRILATVARDSADLYASITDGDYD